MTAEDDKMPAKLAGFALDKQIERGVVALGCNTAFGGMVSIVAKKEKLNIGEARAKALTILVPGVILQPNGIFGVALAQQNGCAFVQAQMHVNHRRRRSGDAGNPSTGAVHVIRSTRVSPAPHPRRDRTRFPAHRA